MWLLYHWGSGSHTTDQIPLPVAPRRRHLMLSDGVGRVVRGPRQNRHRPAMDTLFRTCSGPGRPRLGPRRTRRLRDSRKRPAPGGDRRVRQRRVRVVEPGKPGQVLCVPECSLRFADRPPSRGECRMKAVSARIGRPDPPVPIDVPDDVVAPGAQSTPLGRLQSNRKPAGEPGRIADTADGASWSQSGALPPAPVG